MSRQINDINHTHIKRLRNIFRAIALHPASILLPHQQDREYLPYKWQHYAPSIALLLPLLIVVKEHGELRFSFQYFKHLSYAAVCGSRGGMAGNEW